MALHQALHTRLHGSDTLVLRILVSSTHRLSVYEKDFSTSLEMTIREGLFIILRATL